jgi:CDP-paratose 2-epimerase
LRVLVTGSGGLIGSEAALHWLKDGANVYGIDNNTRMSLFGKNGDVTKVIRNLSTHGKYKHIHASITDRDAMMAVIRDVEPDVIIHAAAQPSHDKAADIPFEDFSINAVGTLNMLEATRQHAREAVFIHVSTNKVYGDAPNYIPLTESEKRYDFSPAEFQNGISESFSIDQCLHSLFGASKASADLVAQEYGRYFGMNIGVFRGGCLTGPQHAGVELHGFLSYIVKCAVEGKRYRIFGYKGKQVRDQIHSKDVISCFERFIESPRSGEVYNLGGGRENSASILEIIERIATLTGHNLSYDYVDKNRIGDHICYYTDMSKFKSHYPGWKVETSLDDTILEICNSISHEMNK